MKKTNNKGFSLVELIVVIAIMAVMVGVLAPTFTKYVEQSRRATDIQNAEAIKTAVLADMADGTLTGAGTKTINASYKPSTLGSVPTVQGNATTSTEFTVEYDTTAGTCSVKLGTFTLTDPTSADNYKKATAASTPSTPSTDPE